MGLPLETEGMHRISTVVAALVLLTAPLPAQLLGSPLAPAHLSGFVGTAARGLDAFAGRAILLEFFVFW
jgi:hypothetical protein